MHGEFIIFNDEDENGKVPGLRKTKFTEAIRRTCDLPPAI